MSAHEPLDHRREQRDELELERCRRCGRVHPATRRDARVCWCGGLLTPTVRWLIVEPELEAVAA
jgi:hypothetical protein